MRWLAASRTSALSPWRDPDSNWGHHDFRLTLRPRRKVADSTEFSAYLARRFCAQFAAFLVALATSWGFVAQCVAAAPCRFGILAPGRKNVGDARITTGHNVSNARGRDATGHAPSRRVGGSRGSAPSAWTRSREPRQSVPPSIARPMTSRCWSRFARRSQTLARFCANAACPTPATTASGSCSRRRYISSVHRTGPQRLRCRASLLRLRCARAASRAGCCCDATSTRRSPSSRAPSLSARRRVPYRPRAR